MTKIETNENIAIIVEGQAECAIINLLIENDRFIFSKEQLFRDGVFTERSARSFCEKNLKMEVDNIVIIRILDSENEVFKIPKAYESKIKKVINIVTSPEIEILIIIEKNDYNRYQRMKSKTKPKPSEYVKEHYGIKKSYDVHYKFWKNNIDNLIITLNKYKTYNKNKYSDFLCDYLK